VNSAREAWLSVRFLAVALCLLGLTAASILVPLPSTWRGDGTLLVLLPCSDPRRQEALLELSSYLGRKTRLDIHLQVASDRTAFDTMLPRAILTLSPDAVALGLAPDEWLAMAHGRRQAPWNHRPVSVLVTRGDPAVNDQPWLDEPERTVFGDSLSLVCLVPLCREARLEPLPEGVGWGADPYDHRAVLVAAAHGAYDHAVVRQWDALAALSAGWLDPARWRLHKLSGPVPDIVLCASRTLPGAVRLDLQEALAMLGRSDADLTPDDRLVQVQLGQLGLDGFNLLLGPDVDRLRRQYDGCGFGPAR
jgi:hypothetical protein